MNPPAPEIQAPSVSGRELLAMGDVGPCELIDGRIVPMTPTGGEHAVIESRLASELTAFVSPRGLGWVLAGEVGVYTRRDPDSVRGTDIAFVPREKLHRPGKDFLEVAPELIVEILSPEDRWQHLRRKIEEYFSIGVSQVWVVEPENRALLVYRSPTDVRRYSEAEELQAGGTLEGLSVRIGDLFTAT